MAKNYNEMMKIILEKNICLTDLNSKHILSWTLHRAKRSRVVSIGYGDEFWVHLRFNPSKKKSLPSNDLFNIL